MEALLQQEPEAWEILSDLESIADEYQTRYAGSNAPGVNGLSACPVHLQKAH